MPFIHNFKSTNIWNAFILNSLAASIVIFIAMTIKSRFDTFKDSKDNTISQQTNLRSIILTISLTFISSFISYIFLHFVFGFGGGMLIKESH